MSFTGCNIQVLDHRVLGYKTLPSEKIYYNILPYKIAWTGKLIDHEWQKQQNEFFYNSPADPGTVRYNGLNTYFSSYDTFLETLYMFSDNVSYCSGPLNDEHLALLLDPSFVLECRETTYYRKYDTKVYMFISLSSGRVTWTEQKATLTECIEFIHHNLDKGEIRVNHFGWGADFYMNYDKFIEIRPFLLLQHSNIRFKITRCVIFDK